MPPTSLGSAIVGQDWVLAFVFGTDPRNPVGTAYAPSSVTVYYNANGGTSSTASPTHYAPGNTTPAGLDVAAGAVVAGVATVDLYVVTLRPSAAGTMNIRVETAATGAIGQGEANYTLTVVAQQA